MTRYILFIDDEVNCSNVGWGVSVRLKESVSYQLDRQPRPFMLDKLEISKCVQ